jgi:hypothetical protein
LDDWLSAHEVHKTDDKDRRGSVRTGVGIYFFQESGESKTEK